MRTPILFRLAVGYAVRIVSSTPDRRTPMDSLDAWLAAMPVQDVDRRIRELEGELEVLRVLKRQHADRTTFAEAEAGAARMQEARINPLDLLPPRRRTRRLSPERLAILRLIAERGEDMAPAEVARALDADQNSVQTTMSRMAQADQLRRVEHGRYRLPPDIPAGSLLNGSGGGEDEE